MLVKKSPGARAAYLKFVDVQTRWNDNDAYGHVNNVAYYAYFDSSINRHLIEQGALDLENGEVIGLCVDSQCSYFAPVAFPQKLEAGLRVGHLGKSSVRYEVGIFAAGSELACAEGHFVHVFVDRTTRRPVELPEKLRATLTVLLTQSAANTRG